MKQPLQFQYRQTKRNIEKMNGNESDKPLIQYDTNTDNWDSLSDANLSQKTSDSKHRLLVVEDNEEIRAYIKSILEPQYIVEEAENGKVGVEMAKEKDFSLIISDLMMPELNGVELCKQIKDSLETSHIPVILLTAKSEVEDKIEGLSVGADSYITKPFHPKHLLVRVEKLIELRTKLKEHYSKKISFGEFYNNKIRIPDEISLQKVIDIISDKKWLNPISMETN